MHRDSEIQRYSDVHLQGPNVDLVLAADAAAESDGLFGIGLRQQQSEFVTTDAESEIRRAHRLPQSRGRELQHLIALQVAVPIVHFLQLVQIEDYDRQLMTVT